MWLEVVTRCFRTWPRKPQALTFPFNNRPYSSISNCLPSTEDYRAGPGSETTRGSIILQPISAPLDSQSLRRVGRLTRFLFFIIESTMSGKVLGFLASGLLFLALQPWSEACSCGPSHPQQDYCQSDVVIKGKIVGAKYVARGNDTDPSAFQWIQYEVQQQKMFKGFEKTERVQYVYTPRADFVCGLLLEADQLNEDYVLSGKVESDGKVYINICSFNKPWSQLTSAQRSGLNGSYKAGCQCTIIPCFSLPCSISADNQCLWTDGIIGGNWAGSQSRRLACSMKPSGLCQWESGKPPRAESFLRGNNQ